MVVLDPNGGYRARNSISFTGTRYVFSWTVPLRGSVCVLVEVVLYYG